MVLEIGYSCQLVGDGSNARLTLTVLSRQLTSLSGEDAYDVYHSQLIPTTTKSDPENPKMGCMHVSSGRTLMSGRQGDLPPLFPPPMLLSSSQAKQVSCSGVSDFQWFCGGTSPCTLA